jgi:2-oxo-4-hydroxy-4-carboxy-5-ureidoimidazoline decarboxylase
VLDPFNAAPADELAAQLHNCCAAQPWIDAIVRGRPYPDPDALGTASDRATAALDQAGLDRALAGHPRIGERAGGAWSRQEQAGVAGAGADGLAQLAAANAAYEQRFGHVYLVCATGKSADELLASCRARLEHDPEVERDVVLGELAQINRLRLAKLLTQYLLRP